MAYTAATAYGNCGIKVWIFRGELMSHDPMAMENSRSTQQSAKIMLSPKRTKFRKAKVEFMAMLRVEHT